jgi:hypothetical protein
MNDNQIIQSAICELQNQKAKSEYEQIVLNEAIQTLKNELK